MQEAKLYGEFGWWKYYRTPVGKHLPSEADGITGMSGTLLRVLTLVYTYPKKSTANSLTELNLWR